MICFSSRALSASQLSLAIELARQDAWQHGSTHYTRHCSRARWWAAFLAVKYDTGLNVAAMLRLERAHLDLPGRRLLLPAEFDKWRQARTVAMRSSTAAAVAAIVPEAQGDRLFPWSGRPYLVYVHHRRLLQAAGVATEGGLTL